MQSSWLTPGVRFNELLFSEPVRFGDWYPPGCPGLVAVLMRDADWAPKPFRPLYFAEFGNDSARTAVQFAAPASSGDLYIAVLPMPFSTTSQRRALRNELVSAYNPVCQARVQFSSDELLQRLEALESRHVDQSAQMVALLSRIARFFEPQPVAPRPAIGFMPEVSAAVAGAALTESGT
jgi:hypothetical protein